MVALLQQAALSNPAIGAIQFQLGRVTLNLAQLQNWLGVDDRFYTLGYLLGSGGIQAIIATSDGTVNGTVVNATFDHIWVKVSISGTNYVFDPAFKTYTRTSPINLASAMGYSRSAFLADAMAGATRTSTSISGINRTNVRNDLQTYAGSLANYIRTSAPSASVADIVGGRSIVPTGRVRQTSLPYQNGAPTESATIPATFQPTLTITLPGAPAVACNGDDIYGHRMTIFFDTSNRPVLRIDGTVVATGTAGSPGSPMSIGTSITVPYFTGASTNTSLNVTVGGSFLIGIGWDQMGRGMVEKHRTLLNKARASIADPAAEPVLGETLAVVGSTWLAEVAAQQQLSDQLLNTTSQYFYGIGVVGLFRGGTTTSPFVDLPLNFVNSPTRANGVASGSPPNTLAAFFDGSGTSSSFESTILEQTQAQIANFTAASTVRLLDIASQTDTIFDINNSAVPGDNSTYYYSTIRPQLAPNYASSSLSTVDAYVNGGYRVVAPLHGRIPIGNWTGVGFKAISQNQQSIGEIISGGLSGGFGGVNDPPGTMVPSTAGTQLPWYDSANGVGDPVDRASGSFLYNHDDLTVGSGDIPYGLGFARSYNSGAQDAAGPLGRGWTHNYAIAARADSDGFDGMGQASPLAASAAITALFVSGDLLNGFLDPTQQNLDLFVVETLVNRWFTDQLTGNVVSVTQANSAEHFVKLADGTTYAAPPGSASRLTRNGDGTFQVVGKDGVTLRFNLDGTIASWTNAAGVSLIFTYSSGQLTTIRNGFGRQLTLGYTAGQITSVSDGLRSVSYSYTGGNLTTFSDALGQATTFAYDTTGAFDTAGHLTQIFYPANPAAAFVTNFYDSLGRVRQQRDGNDNLTQGFFAGRRTELVDPTGTRNVWLTDARGRVVKEIQDFGDTPHLNVTMTFDYDGQGRLVKSTLPEGNTIQVTYDSYSNPLTISATPKSGSALLPTVQTMTYVSPVASLPNFERPRTATDPLGNVTTYGYDVANGNLLTIDQPTVGGQVPRQAFAYNGAGQVVTATDPAGKVTLYTYDPSNGNRLSVTDDSGRLNITTSYGYDAAGNANSTTDPLGRVTTSQYDAQRRLQQVTAPAPLSFVTSYVYDANGQIRQTRRTTEDPLNPQLSSATYFVTGHQRTATDPSGNVATFAYDRLDRLSTITDAENRVTGFTYDALGRPFQVNNTAIQPQPLEQYAYTANGKRQSATDARGNVTSYQYDGLDRLSLSTFPDTSTERFTYDASGNLLTRTTRGGQNVVFTYDPLNRQSTKAPFGEPTVTFTYDLGGRIASVSDAGGAFTYGYDTAGRNTTVTRPDTQQVGYQYDATGNRTRVTWPDSYFATYEYDVLNRMTDVRESGTTLLGHYAYDPLSRRKTLTYANGASSGYSYAPNDDLNSLTQQFTDSSVTFSYAYNKVHQRTTDTVNASAFMFRPTVASTTTYIPNAVNEYTTVGGAALSYDGNGNLTNDGTNSFTYDTENHLLTTTMPGRTASYTYDPLGRRASKTVDGVRTSFLHDGDREIAEFDGAGGLVRRYVFGPDLDEPLAAISSTGVRTFYHRDALGSVIALSDASGATTDRFSYGPFGETNSLAGEPFRYTGHRLDAETGLYYYRARYYSPSLGRFLQTDPIGYAGGLNLYAYVKNNPLNRLDPLGLLDGPLNWYDAPPGFWESMIPVWGSGRQSIYDFRHGNYVWGTINALLAVSDVFLLKAILTAPFKSALVRAAEKEIASEGVGAEARGGLNLARDAEGAAAGNARPRWKLGDPIDAPTAAGEPSWSAQRARYWKNAASQSGAEAEWGADNVARMERGVAPQRYNAAKGGMESMELSHEPIPQRMGGKDVVPRWPQDHATVDPFRRPGY
jgi:RHS repeat-associated protein